MHRSVSAAVLALTLSPLAFAATDSRNWEGEAELGVLNTTGNSDETNINSRLRLVQDLTNWRNSGSFRTLFSESDDQTTSEKYEANLETDYKFTDHQYLFLRGSYDDDRFSGFDFRSSVTTGYGNRVWNQGDRSFLDLSAGVGYRFNKLQEPNDDGERDEDEAIGSLSGQLDYALSETALFRQRLGTEVGFDNNDTITESETSIQASLLGNLSLKVAYLVTHFSDPPAGSASTDTETSLSLLYGF
jgi:putative salt-induced outer membrane protein YdiY